MLQTNANVLRKPFFAGKTKYQFHEGDSFLFLLTLGLGSSRRPFQFQFASGCSSDRFCVISDKKYATGTSG